MSDGPTCGDAGGRRKDGSLCGMFLNLSPSGLCLHHDPQRAEEAQAIRLSGGAARSAKAAAPEIPKGIPSRSPRTAKEAAEWSSWAIEAVATGVIDQKTAQGIAQLCKAFKECLKQSEMDKELKQLRGMVKKFRKAARA